jgi:hypothetical protein
MDALSIEEASWLQDYDAYYYNRAKNRPLPILRIQYVGEGFIESKWRSRLTINHDPVMSKNVHLR